MSKLELPPGYTVKKARALRPNYSGIIDEYPWLGWVKPGNVWVSVGIAKTEDGAIQRCIDHHAKVNAVVTA